MKGDSILQTFTFLKSFISVLTWIISSLKYSGFVSNSSHILFRKLTFGILRFTELFYIQNDNIQSPWSGMCICSIKMFFLYFHFWKTCIPNLIVLLWLFYSYTSGLESFIYFIAYHGVGFNILFRTILGHIFYCAFFFFPCKYCI